MVGRKRQPDPSFRGLRHGHVHSPDRPVGVLDPARWNEPLRDVSGMKPAAPLRMVALVPGQILVGVVLRKDQPLCRASGGRGHVILDIEPEIRGGLVFRVLPPHDSRVPVLCGWRDAHEVINVLSFVSQPLGSDLPGVERNALLLKVEIALRVDHHPLLQLVRPDLGDTVMAALPVRVSVFPIDRDLPRLPAERERALDIRDRVVRAVEGLPLRGVLQDLPCRSGPDLGISARDRLVDPLFQAKLRVPLVRRARDDLLQSVLLPKVREAGAVVVEAGERERRPRRSRQPDVRLAHREPGRAARGGQPGLRDGAVFERFRRDGGACREEHPRCGPEDPARDHFL